MSAPRTLYRSGRLVVAICAVASMQERARGAGAIGGPAQFREEALTRGIVYTPNQTPLFGDGLAFADLDDDGDPDVVLLGQALGLVGVFENDGTGQFTDRSGTSGIVPLVNASGVVAGDYDRDGDLDLYISRLNVANRLLRNDGGLAFTDVTLTAGVGDTGFGTGCAWGDYDGDGWLDLYVPNRGVTHDVPAANRLYHNLGDGTFEEVAVQAGVDLSSGGSFQATFFDYDRDADADLYVISIRGFCNAISPARSHLFENVAGSFVDVTDTSGADACGVDAMCIAPGDFDNNGFQDLYITNTPVGNALLSNQGDGTFVRDETPAGVISYATGWGSVFFDYDNDGFLDLYVCNVYTQGALNRLYHHQGAFPAQDIATALAVAVGGDSYSVAVADIEDDGDLDMLVMNRGEPIRLFVNQEGQTRRWAKFNVYGEQGDRYSIGANVDVRTGSTWRIREVVAGSGYKSQNQLVVHFGLNNALIMDEIVITWPGGTTRTLTNIATNQTYPLYPPDRLGDADGNGVIDAADVGVLVAVLLGTDTSVPHEAVNDFNGDGRADGLDIDPFVQTMISGRRVPG
ncbi:MAG: FG-GAP-like repeat-containing protein [Phycisphaerae bacterium]